jgi:hypothetical protein
MAKCRYCGVSLPGDWRDSEHRKTCRYATPEVRLIHSGLPQKGYPDKNRKPCDLIIIEVKEATDQNWRNGGDFQDNVPDERFS